ncbi:hypothetical protein IKF15_04385 [Candidatus Saccharibacteria bacterium]|nr:hypothetical protein [Candidatus Saccharibacteria bacterium]
MIQEQDFLAGKNFIRVSEGRIVRVENALEVSDLEAFTKKEAMDDEELRKQMRRSRIEIIKWEGKTFVLAKDKSILRGASITDGVILLGNHELCVINKRMIEAPKFLRDIDMVFPIRPNRGYNVCKIDTDGVIENRDGKRYVVRARYAVLNSGNRRIACLLDDQKSWERLIRDKGTRKAKKSQKLLGYWAY